MLSENAELSLRPPVTFPSLSFASVEQGFESGMAYPIEPGHEAAIKNIYQAPPANPENYAYEQKLKKLRKLFYVDLPEQTGDTPPIAGAMAGRAGARAAPHRHARPAVLARPVADFHPLQVPAREVRRAGSSRCRSTAAPSR
jgi:hypothetical protein